MTSADLSGVEKPQCGCSRYYKGSKLKGAFIIQERKKIRNWTAKVGGAFTMRVLHE